MYRRARVAPVRKVAHKNGSPTHTHGALIFFVFHFDVYRELLNWNVPLYSYIYQSVLCDTAPKEIFLLDHKRGGGGGILWEVRDRVRIFGIIYAVTWYLCTFGNVFYLTVDLLSAPRSRASFFFGICWTFPFLFLFSVMPLRRLSIIVSLFFFFLFLGSNCPFWLEEKPKTDPPYIRVKHTHAGVYDIFSKCWAVGNFKRWETWFHSAFSFHT